MDKLKRPEPRTCQYCGIEFIAKRGTYGLYCGHSCSSKVHYEKVLKPHCGNWKGKKHTEEWKQMMSDKLTGRTYTPETITNMSLGAKNRYKKMPHPKPMEGKKHTIESRKQMSDSQKERWAPIKCSTVPRAILTGIRYSLDGKIWRKCVFERDDYTCRICGIRGGDMHAHHIMKFSKYPEFRFETGNGMTMCAKCHMSVHKNKEIIFADIMQGEVIKNNNQTAAHA